MKSLGLKYFIVISLVCSISFAQTVRIVYNSGTPPLKFTDTYQKPNGMLIDIWKFWAQKNSIDVEFIEATWDDSLAMIQEGSADIHAGLYHTNKRDEFLDYANQPLYENKNYFFYNKGVIDAKSTSDFKPFVIGIGNGYSHPFMNENYPDLLTKAYKNDDEVSRAFVNGEVNVVVSAMPAMTYFIKKNNYDIKQYRYNDNTYAYTKKYYGAVKQGNMKLLKRINDGFDNLTRDEIEKIEKKWTVSLNKNYLKDYHYKNIALNQAEKNYLSSKKEIKMCVDPTWFPFESIENGKHVGIIADIFQELQKTLPIPISLIETTTWSESLTFAKERKCDILAGAVRTKKRDSYLNFTQPYLKFPEVIATREDEPYIDNFDSIIHKKIGIVKNSAITELIKSKYPTINLIDVNNVSDGLMQVSQGKLYAFLNTSASISYYISKEGLTNIKIASKVGIDYHLGIAVRNDDLELLEIFNSIITHLDKDKIEDIKDRWLKVKVQEVIDYSIIYKTIVFFIFIILLILYWNRKLNKEIIQKEKLQKELDKLSQVIEQSRVSVLITDTSGVIEYVNPFCCTQTEYAKEELLNTNPKILKSGYQDNKFYKKLWRTILSGKTWQGEFSNKKKNGTIFWESATIAPIFDKSNNIKYFASIKEDITDKVIAREKLQTAQDEAIKANSAKSEFLAKMSHEIRTPMNAVLGMLYLLEKTEISSVQDNYIKKANHAANSLLGIINDILDFSKIEAGKLDIKNEEFEFNDMIMDVLSVMSFKSEEKDLELLAYYDSAMPNFIISDRLRIEQILNNLLSNAIKFTNSGEVLLSTKLIKEYKNYIEIMFCIKDSGIGISKSSQKKLFQEFTQVDSSATRSFQGTGLGLAICKKLSSLLGGEIWIEDSKEGTGSTFCFTIKCEKSLTQTKKKLNKSQITHLNCLVVDDNSSAAEVLTKMLTSFGYTVQTVLSGREAIEKVKSDTFDVIFLDYKMDGLNGIETYKILKNDLHLNQTKTIMVSAYSKEIVAENIQSIGIEGYLSKPISPSVLYNKIFEVQNSIEDEKNNFISKDVVQYFDGAKLLLVEDNELNQEFALHMLEDRGFTVDIACDGIESLAKVKENKYDIILMDIQMPHMDGLEATKHIRKMDGEYFENVPIIALSANALLGDKEISINAGMNNHINKPIDPEQLFNILGQYIDSKEKNIEYVTIQNDNSENLEKLNKNIFDVENTLKKLNNSYEVYVKILKQFSINYKDVYKQIESYLNTKDINSLNDKIHEIKGVSGNIGAKRLYDKLLIIDRLIKKDDMPSLQLLNEFKYELSEVLKAIDVLDEKEIVSIEFDKEKVIELLDRLQNNLEEDIVECETILQEVLPYISEEFHQFSEELARALDEFDTDLAKDLIVQFIKDIK